MSPQAHYPGAETRPHTRLLSSLASRAGRLGSRDPESAAQEALKRSLQHPQSQAAIEYYFAEGPPEPAPPEWPLDRLFAWLYVVLRYVVREEQARAGFRREVSLVTESSHCDPAPDQLESLIQSERESILAHCLPRLDPEYRTVIQMRMGGVAYTEIAARMRVNPNTVATWISRAIRSLSRCVRRRAGVIRRSDA
ncbi:MAG TPA: sigma factor-like helix-turn-helix DNA-binding protein [Candidatus Acidoferrales bacterium]|nr:sigma factor-like helix-turn-helix DNA-binding protein [Candidatus Acidoferrales bacterium]